MVQKIHDDRHRPTALKSSVLSQVSNHSRPPGDISPAADLDASRDGHVSKAIKETIIGEALAKPVRRRTWLARQFGRRCGAHIWSKSSVFCRADKALARRSPARKDLSVADAFGISCASD